MVKARAKADRVAARQVAQTPALASTPAASTSAEAATSVADVETSKSAPASEQTSQEAEEGIATANTTLTKETPPDRTELMRSKPLVVGRFVQILMPILIDVYAASVVTPIRVKTLTGLLKAVSFLDADAIRQVFLVSCILLAFMSMKNFNYHPQFVPIASFASSILSSKDHPSLVIAALQLVDLLMGKVPHLYKPAFRREGVFYEIESIAERPLLSSRLKEKEKEKDSAESAEPMSLPAPTPSASTIPGYKRLNSLSLDPEDAITLRCRVVEFKFLTEDSDVSEEASFDHLRRLVDRLSSKLATEEEVTEALWDLAELFSSAHTSISSFELLQGGVVDALLAYAMEEGRTGKFHD